MSAAFLPKTIAMPQTLEPEPLRAPIAKAEPYPVDALGDVLAGAAKALHETVKTPLALCCQSLLASASLAAQPHFDIKLPWGEIKPLSLFLLTIAESGERKSAIDDLVLGAAKAQERSDMFGYEQQLSAYETDLDAWKKQLAAANNKSATAKKQETSDQAAADRHDAILIKPAPPLMPLRFVSDPTVEGLYKLLAASQPSVGLFSDEGGLLIGGHALNNDNALKTMAWWSKLWDGSPFDRVRAGDGSGKLYGRRMALHQMAQPNVMGQLLSDPMANGQGFLARCLVAYPESTIGTRHLTAFEDPKQRHALKRLFAVLKTLMETEPQTGFSPQVLEPTALPLSDQAEQLAIAAYNQFETLMAAGNDLCELRDRTSKAIENACRLAGVLAVIESGTATREISTGHLENGLVLMQWYLAEALRLRGGAMIPPEVKDAEDLSKWLAQRNISQFGTTSIITICPNPLRNAKRLKTAISVLVEHGYLAQNDPGVVIGGKATRHSWKVLHYVL